MPEEGEETLQCRRQWKNPQKTDKEQYQQRHVRELPHPTTMI